MLELNASQVPNQSAVKDYGVVITEHKVALKAWNENYVSADLYDYPDKLMAVADHIGLKEKLGIIDLGDNKVAFKASNGKYVSADLKAHPKELVAVADEIGSKEKFELIDLGDNKVAFKASNGKYVSADLKAYPKELVAVADEIGSKEKFELIDLGGKAYVPLTPAQDYGTPVAFNARMFYPASDEPLNLSADARLVWMVNDKIDKSDLSWSDSIQGPSELGDNHDGGGAAIADINGNGKAGFASDGY